jgi:hypothetical protein
MSRFFCSRFGLREPEMLVGRPIDDFVLSDLDDSDAEEEESEENTSFNLVPPGEAFS